MFWVYAYFITGFIIPFVVLYFDSKDKKKGEDLSVGITIFILVVLASIITWPILWGGAFIEEFKDKKLKKFW